MLLTACAAKPPVKTALQGNLSELKRAIQDAARAGQLGRDQVVALAQAVAERELTSADGASGAERVRSLRSCARPLRRAMEHRALATDDVAAELTLILLEAHATEPSALLERYAHSPSGAFRAVAARAAARPEASDLRQSFYADPDARVRRAALATAREVRTPSELAALLEVARQDPDPQSRSLSARAAGAIGGERAVLALKDLWARADDPLRIAIVDAWTERASFMTGGERELALAAESGGGMAAVSASYALSRTGGPEAMGANARLRRAIADGSEDEKRLALQITPLSPESVSAILQAAREASPELRVVALRRLCALPAERNDAIRALRVITKSEPHSDSDRRAHDAALSALADAGDVSVSATLRKKLSDESAQTRALAARALLGLGEYTNIAKALADDDADLRTELACAILAREDRAR